MKFAQGALSWILTPFLIGAFFVILFLIFKEILSSIFLFISFVLFLMTILFLVFFRDPERYIGKGLVAPADGKIREISKIKDDDAVDCTKISTFMNLHNVHVNRMPFDGIIKDVVHIDGAHLPAFKKESERNERVIITANTDIGLIKIIQIAGTLARRIVPYVKGGDELKSGDKIGLIRLGSRVDIYLPTKKIKNITVKINDIVKAGADTIAEIND
jgi:phosphatidylserine decarboxylase